MDRRIPQPPIVAPPQIRKTTAAKKIKPNIWLVVSVLAISAAVLNILFIIAGYMFVSNRNAADVNNTASYIKENMEKNEKKLPKENPWAVPIKTDEKPSMKEIPKSWANPKPVDKYEKNAN